MRAIKFFAPQGSHGWLANFSSHEFNLGGKNWPSVEHYFQAMKFKKRRIRARIAGAATPAKAKSIAAANRDSKRRDWPQIRNLVMYNAIRAKFIQHPDLRRKLLKTRKRIIIEDARDDLYWGCGADGSGKNQMGRLLMRLRNNLQGG